MKNIYILSMLLMAALSLTSCDDNLSAEQEQPNAPYVLSLGVTSNGSAITTTSRAHHQCFVSAAWA